MLKKQKYYVVDDEGNCFRGFLLASSATTAKRKLCQLFPHNKYKLGVCVIEHSKGE